MIAGVDGYKHGWAAAIDLGDGTTDVVQFDAFADLMAQEDLSLIVIDVPIGLLARGARNCDVLARQLLRPPRASSVFPAPIRPMLKASKWEEACRIRFKVEGKRCSKQILGILPKIREVDAFMTPDLQARVLEGHPEVSFTLMNGGTPMTFKKVEREGRNERLRLLVHHFPDIERSLSRLSGAATDVTDAYACLWTARRVLRQEAIRLPSDLQMDERGLRAEIVA